MLVLVLSGGSGDGGDDGIRTGGGGSGGCGGCCGGANEGELLDRLNDRFHGRSPAVSHIGTGNKRKEWEYLNTRRALRVSIKLGVCY